MVLSHPAALVVINVAVELSSVYVFPSIQVNDAQASCVSVLLEDSRILRLSVMVLSHPATFILINVAVELSSVYVFPFIQVKLSHS